MVWAQFETCRQKLVNSFAAILLVVAGIANFAPSAQAQGANIDLDEHRTAPVPHRYLHGKLGDAEFQIALPDNWNGKLLIGARGYSGDENSLGAFKTVGLTKGYAYALSDQGWYRFDIITKQEDKYYESRQRILQLTDYTKALVGRHYGSKASRTFMVGGSNGGHNTQTKLRSGRWHRRYGLCAVLTRKRPTRTNSSVLRRANIGAPLNPASDWHELIRQPLVGRNHAVADIGCGHIDRIGRRERAAGDPRRTAWHHQHLSRRRAVDAQRRHRRQRGAGAGPQAQQQVVRRQWVVGLHAAAGRIGLRRIAVEFLDAEPGLGLRDQADLQALHRAALPAKVAVVLVHTSSNAGLRHHQPALPRIGLAARVPQAVVMMKSA